MKKKIDDYPLILTAADLSEIMKVSKRTAYEMMKNSDFPLIRIGRCKRVEREGFFSWLQNQTSNKS